MIYFYFFKRFAIWLTVDDGEYWVGVRPAEAALADQVLVIPQKQGPLRHLIAIGSSNANYVSRQHFHTLQLA